MTSFDDALLLMASPLNYSLLEAPLTYIHNAFYLEEIADSISPYRSTADLLEGLSLASDTELALAYDSCMSGEANEVYPLYLVTNEMQYRGLSFDQLEELLTHHYSFD